MTRVVVLAKTRSHVKQWRDNITELRRGRRIAMGKSVAESDPIETFKSDLAALSITEVIRKHISTGNPRAFSEEEYFELRTTVASEFRLHPSSVVVIGSTRVGFSLNPKHRYRLVHSGSDIDVAIVSSERFDDYWDRVLRDENLVPLSGASGN